MDERVVIVGASVGGAHTAEALRAEGHTGPITLVGAERDLPYDKPPLSKQFLAGDWDAERVTLVSAEQASASRIELRLGVPATGVDVTERRVALADGSEVPYDRLVIATGAAARTSPWAAESGVHLLRTLEDSRALRAALAGDGPVIVVGGGFIGAEVAATAHGAGRPVTVIDPLLAPAQRAVGPEIGALLAQVHDRHGVATRFGLGVSHITGRDGELTVTLTDGERLAAATVVVGIGATPNAGWLAASGLLIDDGVLCGPDCRAVDRDDIYCVGDVARWWHVGHGESVRIEHWTNAAEQAACVAHNIVHRDDVRQHRPTEYVWSDQYDWRIQIAGRPAHGEHRELIGDAEAELPRYVALFADDRGRIGGAVSVNWPRALITSRRQIAAGASYAEAREAIGKVKLPARPPA